MRATGYSSFTQASTGGGGGAVRRDGGSPSCWGDQGCRINVLMSSFIQRLMGVMVCVSVCSLMSRHGRTAAGQRRDRSLQRGANASLRSSRPVLASAGGERRSGMTWSCGYQGRSSTEAVL